LNKFFGKVKKITVKAWNNIFKAFKARSISTQLIITIILIFASFFILQAFLNSTFLTTYYTDKEFDDIHADLVIYVDKMNADNADHFDEMDDFSQNQFAYTVIVDSDYRILESTFTEYTIQVKEVLSDTTYNIIVLDNDEDYSVNDELSVTLAPYNGSLYQPLSISKEGVLTEYNGPSCDEVTCVSALVTVTLVNKPNNLNYRAANLPIVLDEIHKLENDQIELQNYKYTKGYWYPSTDGATDTLVFIHGLGQWQNIVTIVPIADTAEITSIISSYTYYVYLTAIVIIILWSFRLSNLISRPIKNIELVTKEIASLNFNVEAKEFNNKETSSLSESINLIAINLRNTLDSLNTKNTELTKLYDDQTKQVTLKKQLVSSISHELKTPLMIMQVIIQGILDGIIEKADQEDELNNVLEEIQKSSIMIQDMLQIYRLDDAKTKLDVTQFNLSETVNFFIKDFDNVFKSNNLKVTTTIPESVMVEADNKLIKRVISNFVTNAIKYTPENSNIEVLLKQTKRKVYFELINYGVNISKEDLLNIWIPFFRVENATQRQLSSKGSGIGLYLVSEILKAHNADYSITNVENGVKASFSINKTISDNKK
jgi:signal transduction histidine kinase